MQHLNKNNENNIKSILIVKLSSIGDVIMTTPVLPFIRNKYPNAKIYFLVEKESYNLIKLNPYIDEIIMIDRTKWEKNFIKHPLKTIDDIIKNIKHLRSYHFDLSIDFQGLLRSVLFPFLAKVEYRIGRGRWKIFLHKYIPMYKKKIIQHAVENYFDVCKIINIKPNENELKKQLLVISNENKDFAKNYLLNKNINQNKLIIISPYTRWKTKNIPLNLIKEIITEISNKIEIDWFITGMKDNIYEYEILKNQLNSKININGAFGEFGIDKLSALIECSKLVICADSAPMHIASALDKNIIALFGPTDPNRTGPYNKNKSKIIQNNIKCSPCLKRSCPYKHIDCMNKQNINSIIENVLNHF